MSRDYNTAGGWRNFRSHNAHAGPQPCVLCGRPADTVGDCRLPFVPGDDETEPLPGGEAWFVPVHQACAAAATATAPAEPTHTTPGQTPISAK